MPRYGGVAQTILRTDDDRANDTDHIICLPQDGQLACNFADVLELGASESNP